MSIEALFPAPNAVHWKGKGNSCIEIALKCGDVDQNSQSVTQTYLDDYGSTLSGTRAGQVAATDTDVALGRQQNRQPDTRRVEHGRQIVGETEVRVAPAIRDPVLPRVGGEKPDVNRKWPDAGQRVGERDGDQDGVGRSAHARSNQHDADEEVTENGDEHQQRNEIAVDESTVRHVVEHERALASCVTRSHDHRRRCRFSRVHPELYVAADIQSATGGVTIWLIDSAISATATATRLQLQPF